MSRLLMIGSTELVLIVVVALLLFGGKKIPELMRGLGKGVRNFKEGMREATELPDEEDGPRNGGRDDKTADGGR